MRKLILITALALRAVAAPACDLCSIYLAQEGSDLKPGWSAGVYEQYSRFATMRQDGHEIGNPAGEEMDSWLTQVALGIRLSPRLGVQLNAPVILRDFKRVEGGRLTSDTDSGLGDVTLLARARVLDRTTPAGLLLVNLLTGLKAPTGDSSRLKEESLENEETGIPSGLHGHDLARGSGSWDGLFGASLFTSYDRWFGRADAQYAVRTEGDHDFEYADDFFWSAGPGRYLWLDHQRALGVSAMFSGEHKGEDRVNGQRSDDTAMDAVYAGPALTFASGSRLTADLSMEWPLNQVNSGVQLVPDYRVKAGATLKF